MKEIEIRNIRDIKNLYRGFRNARSDGVTSVRGCAQVSIQFRRHVQPLEHTLQFTAVHHQRTGIVKSFNRRPLRPPTIDIVVFVIVFVLGAGAFADWLPRYQGLDLVRSTIGWKQRSGAAASKTRVLLPWGGCKRGAQTWQASISARPLRVNGQVDDHRRLIKRGSRASRLPAIAASFAQLHRMDFLIATPRGERLPVFEHPAIPNGNEIRQLFLYLLQITRLPPRINYTKFEKSKGILLYRV